MCRTLANGRCRLHGGLSTGPRTAAGKVRIAARARSHRKPKRDCADACGRSSTIAELLSGAGYSTGAFGKWHLGSEQSRLPNRWQGLVPRCPRFTRMQIRHRPALLTAGPCQHGMRKIFPDQLGQRGYLNLETRSACSRMTLALSVAAVPVGSPLYMILGFEK